MLQVLEITERVVVCLNLMDEARTRGLTIDDRGLARDLGVPVVPTAARQGEGIQKLLTEMAAVASGQVVLRPRRLAYDVPGLRSAMDTMVRALKEAFPGLPHAAWIAMRLLEGDPRIIEAVSSGELAGLVPAPAVAGATPGTPGLQEARP